MSTIAMNLSLSVIPADMHFRPSQEAAQRALALFKELFPTTADHQAKAFDAVHFINPELFASKALCPTCGKPTERYGEPTDPQRQWFANIDRTTLDAPVHELRTRLPACGHEVPFTELTFEWPAGYASFALIAPYTYWDDDLMHEDRALEEEMEALGAALGTPMRVVRSYHALRPADRRSFEALMSEDEATRIAGAATLDALEHGHFENHPMAASFPEENTARLLAAFHDSRNRDVKSWILYALSDVKVHTPEIVTTVAAHLGAEDELLESSLYMLHRDFRRYLHLTQALLALRSHPTRQIRWRCAMALSHWPLEEAGVLDALHALMLDPDAGVRLQAVSALYVRRALRKLSELDRAVLEKVVAMDEKSAAASHAAKLLAAA